MTKKKKPDDAKPEEKVEDAVVVAEPAQKPEKKTPETEPVKDTPQPVDHDHDDDEEDEGFSLAARTLQILAILLVGAVIGIWVAPKIAANLPVGMAPVAQWLSPSDHVSGDELAVLRDDAEARLTALESLPGRDEFETRLANFQTDILNPLRSQMTTLADQLDASDSTAIEARLWALESRVEGLITELDTLTQSIGEMAGDGGTISADMAASIGAYRTRIDGMQAEINTIAAQQGAMSQRIDEGLAVVDQQVQEAEVLAEETQKEVQASADQAMLDTAVTHIKTALKSGGSYADSLDRISGSVEIDSGLTAWATSGVVTMDTLGASFVPAAHDAIRASINAQSDGGATSAIGAFFRSQVATRSLTEQDGDSTDAILSRVEAALNRDDLGSMLAQADTLPDAAKAAMSEWIVQAQARADAVRGFEALQTALGMGDEQ